MKLIPKSTLTACTVLYFCNNQSKNWDFLFETSVFCPLVSNGLFQSDWNKNVQQSDDDARAELPWFQRTSRQTNEKVIVMWANFLRSKSTLYSHRKRKHCQGWAKIMNLPLFFELQESSLFTNNWLVQDGLHIPRTSGSAVWTGRQSRSQRSVGENKTTFISDNFYYSFSCRFTQVFH